MNARALAIDILARVEATDAFLNVALDTRLAESPPSDPRDTALITELCYGTTRRRLTLDHAIEKFADRKLSALEDRVLAALRIGAYQMFYSRVPRRAAVGESVEALKQLGLERAAGFTNAILRKLSVLEALPLPPETDVAAYLSVRESHPVWLVRRWIRHFGRELAERMLAANNEAAAVVVRTNTSRISRDALLAQLVESGLPATATTLSPVGIRLGASGRVEELMGYAEGLWQVQDEAAQLVGLYGAIPDGARVLDTCAAPGGKACHLAERLDVVASDVHENKLRKITSEAKRLGLLSRLKLLAHDATEPFGSEIGQVEAVFIDAPCTGLGTLRRHPELRYRRVEGDIARISVLQNRILENCQEQVPPGGLLVYAVCSPEPEEGQDLIEMFLRSHPDFTAEPPLSFAKSGWPSYQSYLRTLPGPEGFDGFFAARLRRTY